MLYHCGLLDDDPLTSRSYRWMMRRGWHEPVFPADVLHEISVWVNMPGFDVGFHLRNMHLNPCEFHRKRKMLPDFESVRDDVVTNWLSTTREDVFRIAALRGRNEGVPLIVQFQILDDIKAGRTQRWISRAYGVGLRNVGRLAAAGGPVGVNHQKLPSGFELLRATA